MINSDFLIFIALAPILSTLSFHNEVDKLQHKFSQRWKSAGTGMKYSSQKKKKNNHIPCIWHGVILQSFFFHKQNTGGKDQPDFLR